jgi:hypothetical protein
LIEEPVLNAVLVLVVVTSILGPTLTEHFGRQRVAQMQAAKSADAGEANDVASAGLTNEVPNLAEPNTGSKRPSQ